MEAAGSSEMLVPIISASCDVRILDNRDLNIHYSENLKSCMSQKSCYKINTSVND
jgi:hypothetical protein